MTVYVPGTEEQDLKKVIMSLQQLAQGQLNVALAAPYYATAADLTAAKVGPSVNAVILGGRTTAGDSGGVLTYTRMSSAPSPVKRWHLQSADGAYWYLQTFIASPPMMGSLGDGSDDTAAVQAAMDYGAVFVQFPPPSVAYSVGTINVPSNRILYGSGTIKQRTTDFHVLDCSGVSGIRFGSLKIVGTVSVASGLAVGRSSNNGINIHNNSSDIIARDCTVSRMHGIALFAEQSTKVFFLENYCFENAFGTKFSGVQGGGIRSNTINHTCLYSLTPTLDQFSIGISLDSTAGHTFGICQNIDVSGNYIGEHPYAQAILAHAGVNLTIAKNRCIGSSIGISINPFTEASSTYPDYLSSIAVTGNVCTPTNATVFPPGQGEAGIVVQGGLSTTGGMTITPTPTTIAITGNTVNGFNRVIQDTGLGGIVLGYTRGVTCASNAISGSGCNGIVLSSTEDACILANNSIDGVVPYGGVSNGIRVLANAKANIIGNTIKDASYGVYIDGANTVRLLTGTNQFLGIGTSDLGGTAPGG